MKAVLLLIVALLCAPAAAVNYVGITTAAPSGAAPILITTDIVSGSLTGGESNKGAYLRLYGYNFGSQGNMGSASGVKVYIGGVEVDNYRALVNSRISSIFDGSSVYSALQTLIVQVGAIGGGSGALDVKVTVAGQDSNILTGGFTTQPGRFWYVDNVNGCDSTVLCGPGVGVPFNCAVNDITKPCRFAQRFTSGTTATGLWAATTPNGDAGLRAGDTIVLRDSGSNYVDNVGCDSGQQRFIRFCGLTGTAPTGSGNNGYIHITAYPGAVAGNAPEAVHYKDPVNGNGGIMGADSGHGFPAATVWGRYVSVSGLWLELVASSGSLSGGDAAPINGQYGATNWRVIDNELGPWPSTVTGAAHARAGGYTGQGANTFIMLNYIHDIASSDTAKENHCLYFDGNSTNSTASTNITVSYNWIKNCTGGSAIQFYDGAFGGDATGQSVHHNYIDTWNKYGLNLNTGMKSINAYNNAFTNGAAGALNCIWMDNVNTPVTFNLTHNVCYIASASQDMIGSNAINSGTVKIQHNSMVMANGRADHTFNYDGTTGSAITWQQNLYFDPDGIKTTAPASDASSVYGNPNFTNYTGNFRTTAGGAGIAACTLAEALAVADDLYSVVRPVTGTGAPGATKNDIGATQGIGT